MMEPYQAEIKVRYLRDIEPIGYTGGSAKSDWIDLRAGADVDMRAGDFKLIPLGVAIQLPDGFEAIMAPRSSTYKRWGIIAANSIGVIDESYCGDDDEWHFPALAMRDTHISAGDRICQFRIIQHQPEINITAVDQLGNTSRGGLGSTGTR